MSRIIRHKLKIKEAEDGLARLVCSERMPVRSLCDDDNPFMAFSSFLNPNFHPSFETLEPNCLKVYVGEREEVKGIFSKIGGHISLSVDLLMHEESFDEYICLNAHFIR